MHFIMQHYKDNCMCC